MFFIVVVRRLEDWGSFEDSLNSPHLHSPTTVQLAASIRCQR